MSLLSHITSSNPWGHRGTAGSAIANQLLLQNLHKSYGKNAVIANLSMNIKAGEVIALLGSSGCGKSTLLRMIAGLESIDSGSIYMDRLEVNGKNSFLPPEERGIGFVFQDYALFPHLTNIGNVKFGLKHLPKTAAIAIALRALERVGLADKAHDYPETLSGGMQQRVALARAIAPRPGLLLMDEPFSGLDERLRQDVRDETLAVIRETRATCLIVTHSPEEAMMMANRIALLKDGHLVQFDTPAAIYKNPVDMATARFFSDINELSGTVYEQSVETALGRVEASFGDGRKVDIAVRPQSIVLSHKGEGTVGRIVSKRYVGEHELFEVALQGFEKPMKARKRAGSPFNVGELVHVNIIRNEALVFAAVSH